MNDIQETIDLVEKVRAAWPFTADPGPGRHPFGEGFVLCVKEFEQRNKVLRTYFAESADRPGDPITLANDWDIFHAHLTRPTTSAIAAGCDTEMTKQNVHDVREMIRLKCLNDWDLDLTEDQISMCILEMKEQNLSLFHNQLWPNQRKWRKKVPKPNSNKFDFVDMHRITWDKTIDGYRAIAHRTGRFAGMDSPDFALVDDQLIARMTVYALDSTGKRRAYTGEARFNEFVQLVPEFSNGERTGRKIPNSQWSDSPYNQISIAAERQALRKAFQEVAASQDEEHVQLPEPPLERSRGEIAPLPIDEVPSPSRNDVKSPPAPKVHFECLGRYRGDRILMLAAKQDQTAWLALDSGTKVLVNDTGQEIERRNREDEFRGGKKWQVGDLYFDGSKVVAVSKSKSDEWSAWLTLDNNTKVRLNRWGKHQETRAVPPAKTPSPSTETPKPPEAQEAVAPVVASPSHTPPPDDRPAAVAGEIQTSDAPAEAQPIDSLEKMRQQCMPLLKKWCDTVFGKRVSPKHAYLTLAGVVIESGEKMSLSDYRVLFELLTEAIAEYEATLARADQMGHVENFLATPEGGAA